MKSLKTSLLVSALLVAAVHGTPITSFADPALAGATVINFDSQTPGNYASVVDTGVTFTTNAGELRIADYTEGGVFGGSGLDLSTRDTGGPSSLNVQFASPVSAWAVTFGAANPNWTVMTYDSLNSLIESITVPGGEPWVVVGGSTSNPLIDRVEMFASDGLYDWVKFDDFRFVSGPPSSTPDGGSTAVMLFCSALGLAGAHRKFRK